MNKRHLSQQQHVQNNIIFWCSWKLLLFKGSAVVTVSMYLEATECKSI